MGIRTDRNVVETAGGDSSPQKIVSTSATRGRSLFIWGLCCAISGIVFLVYALTSLAAGRGQFLMPLDDAYIHFQYAKQIATGQLYVYNPGLPPTSGATSFLYPYMLAFGYLIGFQGLNLGLWAMLIGMVALAVSTWLVYSLGEGAAIASWRAGLRHAPTQLIGVLMAAVFTLNGAVSWHFMSGMETGLVILFSLLTLYMFTQQRYSICCVSAMILALLRPEGGILALIVVGAVGWRVWKQVHGMGVGVGTRYILSLHGIYLFLPILAVGMQPLVNLIFTGSMVASGNAAKSIFGMIPPNVDVIAGRIVGNFARMWKEFFTGYSPREGWYLVPPLTVLAILSSALLLFQRRWIFILIALWLVAGTSAIATLDTAFWHFKRYQMPLLALLFVLAGWGVIWLYEKWHRLGMSAMAVMLAGSLITSVQFLRNYAVNVDYVYLQPVQMAQWLQANTPPDAVVAVHDTGLIRYIGGRTTIDMVGLTTPGAADAWRNGPGAIAEFLEKARPDYIAAYGEGHGLGLGYLARTDLYGEPLASFPVILDQKVNVALAADFQGIYQPDWAVVNHSDEVWQIYTRNYLRGMEVVDSVDVADLDSETAHNYHWRDSQRLPGFPTEVYQQSYLDCLLEDCRLLDGGRLINGEELFTLHTRPNHDLILVTRLHPFDAGTFDVYANDTLVGTRVIPAIPGNWLEVQTLISKAIVTGERLNIRIVPHTSGGHYMPYYHWAYQGNDYLPTSPYQAPITTFQDDAIELVDSDYSIGVYADGRVEMDVSLFWHTNGNASGDYISFVHVYNQAGEIIAQADQRPSLGTLSPGNWLPGMFRDSIELDLTDVSPGSYPVAVGLYEPVTLERLEPRGGDAERRFFINHLELPDYDE